MRIWLFPGLFLAVALTAAPHALLAQPDIPLVHYRAVAEWPKPVLGDKGLPAGPWNYWQVSSVAVEKNGNILVLHRGDYPILEYRPNGDLIGPWGELKFDSGKVMPMRPGDKRPDSSGYQSVYGPAGCSNCGAHELRVDPQGNVWAVDAPAHVIVKMNPSGKVLMTLGTRGKPGMTEHNFYMPTDIAFAPNGELIVSDGYGNARVMRFSSDGRLLGQFGRRGNGPGEFQLPHNVVVDRSGRIYVSDRDNQRVEVFDPSGKYLSQWEHIGGVSSLIITPDQKIWTGGVLHDLDGKVLEGLPGESPSGAHGAAIAANGDIYLGFLNGTVKKFVRQ
jgi:DNA-binding beta-propeller fold protein YncE